MKQIPGFWTVRPVSLGVPLRMRVRGENYPPPLAATSVTGNQAGSTLRVAEHPAAETPGTCRGRCCLAVPPAPGHSGLGSFQASVPGGGWGP